MIPLIKPYVGGEELAKIKEVLDSGHLTEGSFTEEFENKFAKYVNAKYAVAVTSATTGLELVLKCVGIKHTEDIIVPDFTYPATADVVYLCGAKCTLVDVDIKSRNTTYGYIKEAISKNTKAAIPVSEFGNPLDKEIYELKEDIFILEDAATAIGSEINGRKVGSFADATVFSFHPRKLLTTGEGGMITTDNEELYEKLKSYKMFDSKPTGLGRFSFDRIGTNYKMSNVLAAIGLAQLDKIEEMLKDRIKKAEYYNKLFSEIDGIGIPVIKKNSRHTYQSYTLLLKENRKRDYLIGKLLEKGIQTQIGTYALHLQKAFIDSRKIGGLLNSEKLYNNLLTIPLYYGIKKEEQEYIFENINSLLKIKKE